MLYRYKIRSPPQRINHTTHSAEGTAPASANSLQIHALEDYCPSTRICSDFPFFFCHVNLSGGTTSLFNVTLSTTPLCAKAAVHVPNRRLSGMTDMFMTFYFCFLFPKYFVVSGSNRGKDVGSGSGNWQMGPRTYERSFCKKQICNDLCFVDVSWEMHRAAFSLDEKGSLSLGGVRYIAKTYYHDYLLND